MQTHTCYYSRKCIAANSYPYTFVFIFLPKHFHSCKSCSCMSRRKRIIAAIIRAAYACSVFYSIYQSCHNSIRGSSYYQPLFHRVFGFNSKIAKHKSSCYRGILQVIIKTAFLSSRKSISVPLHIPIDIGSIRNKP